MIFKYEGYNRSAEAISGEMEATSLEEVKMRLRQMAVSPRSIVSIKSNVSVAGIFHVKSRPNLKNLKIFIRQWATMQSAGLTLTQSLSVLAEQSADPSFGKTINGITKEILEGQTLTQALQKSGVFDKVFINLIGAGEGSGTLDRILERLAVYYEKMSNSRRKVMMASIYPVAILVIVSLIVIGLMIFVVPMFETMFAEQGKGLPAATQILINVSHFVRDYFLYLLLGVTGMVASLIYLFNNEEAREKIDPVLLYIPIFGNIIQKSSLSRFCRTLGTLTNAGVPILDALNLSAKVTNNFEIERAVYRVHSSVKEGTSIAKPLETEKSFPRMLTSMIAIGEQTGELEKMLMKVAEFYEEEVDSLVSALTSILEPLLIVTMGVVVVCVLIPLYLPIFQMGDIAGGG